MEYSFDRVRRDLGAETKLRETPEIPFIRAWKQDSSALDSMPITQVYTAHIVRNYFLDHILSHHVATQKPVERLESELMFSTDVKDLFVMGLGGGPCQATRNFCNEFNNSLSNGEYFANGLVYATERIAVSELVQLAELYTVAKNQNPGIAQDHRIKALLIVDKREALLKWKKFDKKSSRSFKKGFRKAEDLHDNWWEELYAEISTN